MSKRCAIAVAGLMLLVPLLAMGQNAAGPEDDSASIGRVWHDYTVRQSIEFGERITGIGGNQQMYDTLVNLHDGPRLLGQDLWMQPMKRDGSPFDNLYLSGFGFGGDPNDMARLRIEKGKWYNFVALYRRDVNFFDDNLFANPLTLNPGITNCGTVAAGAFTSCTAALNPKSDYYYTNSPHLQATTRNMGDFNLTLFPMSGFTVRLGFSRNNNQRTVDSNLEDVNIDLTQQIQSRSDRWTFGVDLRPLARTTLSFDQFFEHDKVDTAYRNNPQDSYTLGAGGPGVSIPVYFPPCSVTHAGSPQPYITAPGVLNPLCNTGVFSYSRSDNVRSFFPTSQLSLRSNYFRDLDLTASGSYSSGNSKVLNYGDIFHGLISRSNETGVPGHRAGEYGSSLRQRRSWADLPSDQKLEHFGEVPLARLARSGSVQSIDSGLLLERCQWRNPVDSDGGSLRRSRNSDNGICGGEPDCQLGCQLQHA